MPLAAGVLHTHGDGSARDQRVGAGNHEAPFHRAHCHFTQRQLTLHLLDVDGVWIGRADRHVDEDATAAFEIRS